MDVEGEGMCEQWCEVAYMCGCVCVCVYVHVHVVSFSCMCQSLCVRACISRRACVFASEEQCTLMMSHISHYHMQMNLM